MSLESSTGSVMHERALKVLYNCPSWWDVEGPDSSWPALSRLDYEAGSRLRRLRTNRIVKLRRVLRIEALATRKMQPQLIMRAERITEYKN